MPGEEMLRSYAVRAESLKRCHLKLKALDLRAGRRRIYWRANAADLEVYARHVLPHLDVFVYWIAIWTRCGNTPGQLRTEWCRFPC